MVCNYTHLENNLPKIFLWLQPAGFHKIPWLWRLGQMKDNAKSCHILVHSILFIPSHYTPSCSISYFLTCRLMHTLPGGSWFIPGPDHSLSSWFIVQCSFQVKGNGIICSILYMGTCFTIVKDILLCYICTLSQSTYPLKIYSFI